MTPGIPRCKCGAALSWIFRKFWCPDITCSEYRGPGAR